MYARDADRRLLLSAAVRFRAGMTESGKCKPLDETFLGVPSDTAAKRGKEQLSSRKLLGSVVIPDSFESLRCRGALVARVPVGRRFGSEGRFPILDFPTCDISSAPSSALLLESCQYALRSSNRLSSEMARLSLPRSADKALLSRLALRKMCVAGCSFPSFDRGVETSEEESEVEIEEVDESEMAAAEAGMTPPEVRSLPKASSPSPSPRVTGCWIPVFSLAAKLGCSVSSKKSFLAATVVEMSLVVVLDIAKARRSGDVLKGPVDADEYE